VEVTTTDESTFTINCLVPTSYVHNALPSMSSPIRTLVLVGKLGHGKTSVINRICGAHFLSQMGARSCTTSLQFGSTRKYGLRIVDTPGLYSSERIAEHVAIQKSALELTMLSGIYIVVTSSEERMK
jgi:GTP-binding protein EngB required for normal cell division